MTITAIVATRTQIATVIEAIETDPGTHGPTTAAITPHAPHYVTELMEKDALMRFARELS